MLGAVYPAQLALAAAFLALLAVGTATLVARRVVAAESGTGARRWLAGGSLTVASGLWVAQWLGLLAAVGVPPDVLELAPLWWSWLLALAVTCAALWLVTRTHMGWPRAILGGVLTCAGLLGLHWFSRQTSAVLASAAILSPLLAGLLVSTSVLAVLGTWWLHQDAHQDLTRPRWTARVPGILAAGTAAAYCLAMASTTSAPMAVNLPHTTWMLLLAVAALLLTTRVMARLEARLQGRTQGLVQALEDAHLEHDRLTRHEPLTQLLNRNGLLGPLERLIDTRTGCALVYLNLDGFKVINDAFGHHIGDTVLVDAARRLRSLAPAAVAISRQGGDEFALLVTIDARAQAEEWARRVVVLFREPIEVCEQTLRLSASAGVATHPQDSMDAATLLSHAQSALSRAKAEGRDRYVVFDPRMSTAARERMHLAQALGPAMEHNEFYLVYQPKYAAGDDRLVGVEALIRWQHPSLGVVGPDLFIALAERTGMINELGRWILDEACRQLALWHRQGALIQMSINLSVQQFCGFQLIADLRQCLQRHRLPAKYLTLEITESIAMQDVEHSLRMLEGMRDLGVRISIDDFGTGYSSLAYLKRLLAHELKIDRSFVKNVHKDKEDAAIVTAIIALGNTLGMTVTAEGVETEAQKDFLRREGCTLLQGYLLGRPVRADLLDLVNHAAVLQPATTTLPVAPRSTTPDGRATAYTSGLNAPNLLRAANGNAAPQ